MSSRGCNKDHESGRAGQWEGVKILNFISGSFVKETHRQTAGISFFFPFFLPSFLHFFFSLSLLLIGFAFNVINKKHLSTKNSEKQSVVSVLFCPEIIHIWLGSSMTPFHYNCSFL